MAEFEVFTKDLPALRRGPALTIQKNGIISINRPSWAALGNPEAVELLYDRALRTIGLRAVDPRAPHACAVRSVAGPGSAALVVSAMAFLHYYELQQPVSRRWQARLEGGVLCVDLDDESQVVTSNRARRRPFA